MIPEICARRQDRLKDIDETGQKDINYVIGTVRSFWSGFQQDFYNKDQSKLDKRCFDEESEDEISEIWYAIKNPDVENIFDAVIAAGNLFYDDY